MCLLLLNASIKEFSYFLSADNSIFLCVGLSELKSFPAIDLFYTRARAATLEWFPLNSLGGARGF